MLDKIFDITHPILTFLLSIILNISVIFGITTATTTQNSAGLTRNTNKATTTIQEVTENVASPQNKKVITKNNSSTDKSTSDNTKLNQKNDTTQVSYAVNTAILQSQNLLKKILEIQNKQTRISINLNNLARKSLVNILCTTRIGGLLKPITGSGVVIDKNGVIITNAHIGQYFLIKDYPTKDSVNCIIRTDSPASPTYKAKILYISPNWIKDNANNITMSNPKGTGENDFALLLITDAIKNGSQLPEKFPFLIPDISSDNIKASTPVLLASYPAGFLGGITIQKDLWITTTISSIKNIFTFKSGTIDVFSLNSNIVAQKGSSGGAVINIKTQKLIGIIVTSTEAVSTEDRELNAITLFHINESINKDLGFGLFRMLNSNLQVESNIFNQKISPILRQFLINEMEK